MSPPDFSRDARSCPRISAEETRRLAAIVRDAGRPEADRLAARNAIVTGHLPLAFRLVRPYRRRPGVSADDLLAEACFGLIAAAAAYDPGRGTAFSTLASTAIRRRLWRAAHDDRLIAPPFQLTRPLADGRESRSLAARTAAAEAVAPCRIASLSPGAYARTLEAPDRPAGSDAETAELLARLPAAIERLAPRQREAIRLRLAGHDHAAIGRLMGISREWARCFGGLAMRALRAELEQADRRTASRPRPDPARSPRCSS